MRRFPSSWNLPRVVSSAVGVIGTVVVAGCSGGGCSGCGGGPIPGSFPNDQRIPSAADVRVTRAGLDFLQANISPIITKILSNSGSTVTGGIMNFAIPKTSGSGFDYDYTVCPNGPNATSTPPQCEVEIEVSNIQNVKLNAGAPHDLNLSATIPIRIQDLPVDASATFPPVTVHPTICTNTSDPKTWVNLPVTADISLETIPNDTTHAARAGYTKINIKNVTFDQNTLSNAIQFCGGGIGNDILNGIKGLFIGGVISGLTDKLVGPLQDATCMKATTAASPGECPTGTFDRSGTCRYADSDTAECVPMLLGLETRMDLSSLLASISPGTKGTLDLLLAGGGDMNPANNGMTLSMFGGSLPVPQTNCVPKADNPVPTDIPVPADLTQNTITPWAEPNPPHLGIAVAERMLNHITTSAYNAGLFCVGVSSDTLPQLDAGLFSLLIPSINQDADQFSAGTTHPAMGLAIRPQNPPTLTVGDNTDDFSSPLLSIALKETALDFYMFSEGRLIRLFTGSVDVGVGVNIDSTPDGLAVKLPPSSPIKFTNAKIVNKGLVLEDDTTLANVIGGLGSLIPASALANIKPFNLNSSLASLGLELDIPPDGIRKLTEGSDRFLGIFATLQVASSAVPTSRTTASVSKLTLGNRENYETAAAFAKTPTELWIHAQSDLDDGMHVVEYAYRVDGGIWSTFQKKRDFQVVSPFLNLEGKHAVDVSSRIVGVPHSEGEAAHVPVVIDVAPPSVKLQTVKPGEVNVLARDVVTKPSALKVDVRIDDGAWTEVPEVDTKAAIFERKVKVPMEGGKIDVRVEDESGQVTESTAALLRGRPDPNVAAGSGCGSCAVGSSSSKENGTLAGIAALAIAGVIAERRRRRRKLEALAASSVFVLSSGAMGCSCSTNGDQSGPPPVTDNRPELTTYVKGSWTSAAVGSDGKIWVAGYHEGDPSTGDPNDFKADLIVGQWDDAKQKVAWVAVDGVPQVDPDPTLNPNGFRSGITDPGDDVGMYTSMVLDSKNRPIVSYFDRTNGALRVATYDGSKWASHQVDAPTGTGWAGHFTAMTMVTGSPVVAYQTLELGNNGYARAKVRLARASVEDPSSSGDWSIEDVVVDEKAPCDFGLCSGSDACLTGTTPVCTATVSGCASCSNTQACVSVSGTPTCANAKMNPSASLTNAIGDYIAIAAAPSGDLGIVFYDRTNGNLRGSVSKGGAWSTTPVNAPLDGWTGDATKDATTGDRGYAVSLAIDPNGTWHLAYVDGITEALLYMQIPNGDFTKKGAPIVVDDGLSADGTTAFKDGLHLVGDDAFITADGTNIAIAYQDSSAGTLRWAKASSSATPTFTRGVITQDGFGGFFPTILATSTGNQIVNFFRETGETNADPDAGIDPYPVILGDVRVVPMP